MVTSTVLAVYWIRVMCPEMYADQHPHQFWFQISNPNHFPSLFLTCIWFLIIISIYFNFSYYFNCSGISSLNFPESFWVMTHWDKLCPHFINLSFCLDLKNNKNKNIKWKLIIKKISIFWCYILKNPPSFSWHAWHHKPKFLDYDASFKDSYDYYYLKSHKKILKIKIKIVRTLS